MTVNRRRFLQTTGSSFAWTSIAGLHALGLGIRAPQFLVNAGEAANARGGDRILVIVQMSGGNDGLNTVIPFADDIYHQKRPTLKLPQAEIRKLDDHFGLHPSLSGLAKLFEANQLAVVQGVGYAHPNRSHFESMDIWHTCQTKTEQRAAGWLGKFLDQATSSGGASDVMAMHLGGEQQPLALQSRNVRVPSIKSIDEFKLRTSANEEVRRTIEQLALANRSASSDLLGFVQTSTSTALAASDRVAAAQSDYKTSIDYPATDLARKLRIVAQLINAGLSTRIYYVTLDGFDTHSQQADAHTALLREWSDAVTAFVDDMREHKQGHRVVTFSFSEFGRRVEENASKGTDHGAAAPIFLAGDSLQAGLIGVHPSLKDLDDGDLKFHTDFRQVYATLLEDWLKCDSQPILGASYSKLPLFS